MTGAGDPPPRGFEEAATRLYEAIEPKIFKYLNRLLDGNVAEAENLTNETFLRYWRRYSSLMLDDISAKNICYKIATNLVQDGHRRNTIAQFYHFDDTNPTHLAAGGSSDPHRGTEIKDRVEAMMAGMDQKEEALIFWLIKWEGYKLPEVARILGIDEELAKKKYNRSRIKARDALQRYERNEGDKHER